MSTPPTPIINLDSPKEEYEADEVQQWTQDSTESAKNGTLQEWITEPLQMLTSASPTSAHSPNNESNAPTSTTGDIEVKREFTELPAQSNGANQLLSLTTNGHSRLPSVSMSNGQPTAPATSNGYHQVYYTPSTTTSEYQVTKPRTSNGYHQQIPIPVTNGANYGIYNYGVQYTGPNGSSGYIPNGVQLMNVRAPTQVVHPMRANGGYNIHAPNRPNGYVNGMVNGRFIRPGWVSANKVTNGVKKQKRNRTAFTSHQMMELEQEYAKTRYLDRTRRIELSETLNLNQRTIKIWFQNRRMKEKKDRLEEVTTSDSPPENISEIPIFLEDGSYVGAGNGQFNPAMYAENMPMPTMSPMLPPAMTQGRQAPDTFYMVESAIPVYNPVHSNGIQAPQPSMIPANGGGNNALSVNGEENWDLSWIRSINMGDDMELA